MFWKKTDDKTEKIFGMNTEHFLDPNNSNAGSGVSIALKLALKTLPSPIVVSKSTQEYFRMDWPFKQITIVADSEDVIGIAVGLNAVAIDEASNIENKSLQSLRKYKDKAKVLCYDLSLKPELAKLAKVLGINYIATSSVSDYNDMMTKVRNGLCTPNISAFVQVLTPDPVLWGYLPKNTIRVAKIATETEIYPLLDTQENKVIRKEVHMPKPADDFLNAQSKFKKWPQ